MYLQRRQVNIINCISYTDAKRIIGRNFEDIPKDDLKHWPFKIKNQNGKPVYNVCYKNNVENYSPEMISACILREIKEFSEKFLNESVTDAVITVPAHFNDSQRQGTKDAAEIAGINVLQLLNERQRQQWLMG